MSIKRMNGMWFVLHELFVYLKFFRCTLIFEMEISHWIRNYNNFFYKLEKSAEFSQGYHISNWQVGHTIIGICHNRTFISDLLLLPSNSCNMSYGTNITGIP